MTTTFTPNRRLVAVALVALLVGSAIGLAAGGVIDAPTATADDPNPDDDGDDPTVSGDDTDDDRDPSIDRFDSSAAFASYLRDAGSSTNYLGGGLDQGAVAVDRMDGVAVEEDVAMEAEESAEVGTGTGATSGDGDAGSTGGPDRYSETNVQEAALDEPDILKTDGRTIYYADRNRYDRHGDTHVVDASEPTTPSKIAEIPTNGELLLTEDTVVSFARDRLHGYDVSDPSEPEQTWSTGLDGHVETARLADGDLYLVVADRADPGDPCPLEPLGNDGPEVACTDVHYPTEQTDADTVYTTMRVDPATGEVEDRVSFLGSARTTATYVSENAVYLTYADSPSQAELRLEFLLTDGRELLDEDTVERLERLESYDISDRAKRIEIDAILREWRSGFDREERRSVEREFEEAWTSYAEEHMRQFTRTGVVKVDIDGDLAVSAAGSVPGTPLNQWSMDEHDGHLRIATTVRAPAVDSENDLYVLDGDLETVGEVVGMGVDERIYSVRYEGDTAYVVTFREIDPFHVIDVSDPGNPELQGELKLPGFSTYMHPLGEDRVLGIGEERGNVKAVIFDASDPENPVVEDDAVLDDRWSAVRDSHNAFLIDERHGVFFLPGSDGGHVFAYEDGLERVTTVETDGPALRAMYLEDYLYVFGEAELVVVDETTWEEETYLDLRED
ncbi:beta-propeller domain-containing protein [Halobacteria archaeon AArc-m2/3/4]|uniref:Beta-propeller domain-containing protein n=1 Tax=Natronoglomus mannanivorans TaxID=2979990 RepID=A0ABT2QFC9_9EURY|nr:beta-propeller domain-containing protein [Halobacteria archaeon AArc-m2/3/4]